MVSANNVSISNGRLVDHDSIAETINIQFDISWKNSWRISHTANNWDAAWVFAKYKSVESTEWKHVTLSDTEADHFPPPGAEINPVTEKTGVFIYKSDTSPGPVDVNWQGVKLRWDYGEDVNVSVVDIRLFAIEMVYVPPGNFQVGDGFAGSLNRFINGDIDMPYVVTQGQIQIGQETGNLWDHENSLGNPGLLHPDFPTGYNAYYCMKYEISQGQYAAFLNTLTLNQANNRFPLNIAVGHYRFTIHKEGSEYIADVPDRACNYLSWADGAAYADWAGLRPMSELEYEKTCRGILMPVLREFAWGSTSLRILSNPPLM